MKIDQSLKTIAPAKAKEVKGGKSNTLSRQARQDTVHDQVDLTGSAARMQELEDQLAQLSTTNPQKVEAIRQAIADGTFQVDNEVVADGMIKETLDFLSPSNR